MDEHIVVVSGATPLPPHVIERIPDTAIVLAVDGGIDHALAAGLEPSGLIGDLDSVSADGLAWAEANATIARHPVDKDHTDTELALAFAAAMMPGRITLVGGGDRLDHTLGALGALGSDELTSVPSLDAWWDGEHVSVVHGPGRAVLHLEPGSRLSLLALHGACTKVSINGVRWPLHQERLGPMVGRGISNEVLDGVVDIRLSTGVLTVFDQPATDEPEHVPDHPKETTS